VLGGGIVPGSIVLVGGDPGIGKSTLMLQMAMEMAADTEARAVCVGRGIRTADQDARDASRRGTARRSIGKIVERFRCAPAKKSFAGHRDQPRDHLQPHQRSQTRTVDHRLDPDVYLSELDSSAGSVSQVRECSSQLRELAKTSGISVFVIGHVTKEGTIAGPRVLEHIVDTVLYLEGDRFQAYRLLRSVKNRFGATSEVGVFEMREGGLVEVANPSEAFLAERMINAAGSPSP
jgi:DNA repair protein RadA/Sms